MLQKTLDEGVTFLNSQQRTNGSFISYSSPNPENFDFSKKLHAIFPTSLILMCLNQLEETPQIKEIKQKAAAYLLLQKSENWSFNYWQRGSKESKKMPYPDDLDDTFCALAALQEFNPKLLDGAALAHIISLLTALETREGGPYKTWLISDDAAEVWRDVDLVVNSNIAYFLALQDIELPNLISFIETSVKYNKISSPYYNSQIPVIYFISRWYKGKKRQLLIEILLKTKGKTKSNSMLQAFLLLALLNFEVPPEQLSADIKLLKNQQHKGSWKPFGFYIDPVMQGKKHFAGSQALTTAFCLLAIDTHDKLLKKQSKLQRDKHEVLMMKQIQTEVATEVLNRFVSKNKKIKNETTKIINQVLSGTMGEEITVLPYFVARSGKNTNVPSQLLVKLGSASLYGWIAYTIYDDLLDGEGDAKMLPIANIALRELTSIFTTVIDEKEAFTSFFNETMDELEFANNWEIKSCRVSILNNIISSKQLYLPDYKNYEMLAKRSMGHAIAPTAVLFYLGYKRQSLEITLLLKFFHHYIIARQLNDDAHDFEEDLKHGHINAVAANVLRTLEQNGHKIEGDIDLLVKKTKDQFWQENIVYIYKDILKHTKKARTALQKNIYFANTDAFEKRLSSIESLAIKTLEDHKNVNGFLSVYHPKPQT